MFDRSLTEEQRQMLKDAVWGKLVQHVKGPTYDQYVEILRRLEGVDTVIISRQAR